MKKIILFTALISLLSSCFLFKNNTKSSPKDETKQTGQLNDVQAITYEQTLDSNTVFVVVERNPEFPGGRDSLFAFLIKNIEYPEEAKKKEVTGKVYAQFIVERNGDLSDIKIIRGIGSGCDEEAVRVIKTMPKWIPGKQREKKVRVRFVLPINFALR